jgi:hypothetical protein
MLDALKSLLVVSAVAWVVFALAKPICLRVMAEDDFLRRRNVWFVLTAAGLMSPNIWLFALVSVPILVWSGRKDGNIVALYLLLLHVVPPIGKQIPTVLVNQLFEFNFYRTMALALLVPAAWRLMGAKSGTLPPPGRAAMDKLVLGYLALALVVGLPYESITNTLRRTFLFGIDAVLIYYVVSRTCNSYRSILEAMASLALAGAIAAPLAMVEAGSTWLLFGAIGDRWETIDSINKLLRGETLRAQVSAGHALALGYMLSIGFCCWLHLRSKMTAKWIWFSGGAWIVMGLGATLSRGPLLASFAGFFAYMALGRHGSARLVKAVVFVCLLLGVVYVSPFGDEFVDLLPFIGTVDAENVVYRQRLAETSLVLIGQNPVFGDPLFLSNMEELRQGQGIIDLVNVYATVALQTGIVGLSLFLGLYVFAMRRSYQAIDRSIATEPAVADQGAALVACLVATLLMMAVGSFGTSLAKMYYVLAGLAAGYIGFAGAAALVPETGAAVAPAAAVHKPEKGVAAMPARFPSDR